MNDNHPKRELISPAVDEMERQFIQIRRKAAFIVDPSDRHKERSDVPDKSRVGVALSGGGIRSATFCLGLFQSLAAHGQLKYVDYLSTVSGGGYFGSFLGRMFTQKWVSELEADKDHAFKDSAFAPCADRTDNAKQFLRQVAKLKRKQADGDHLKEVADPVRRVEAALKDSRTPPLAWLRASGSYLTPGGANDGALAIAVYIRNWVAMLVVPLLLVLTVFLLVDAVRAGLLKLGLTEVIETRLAKGAGGHLWWAPSLFLPLVGFLLWMFPLGMAYWLTQGYKAVKRAYILTVLVGTACAIVLLRDGINPAFPASLALTAGLALLYDWFCDLQVPENERAHPGRWKRNELSSALRMSLLFTAGTFVFALFDTWGQSLYALISYAGSWRQAWPAISMLFGLGAAGWLVRSQLLKGGVSGWLKVPFRIVALLVGVLLVSVLFTGLSFVGHGLAWRWQLAAPVTSPEAEKDSQLRANLSPGGKIYRRWYVQRNEVSLSSERHIVVGPPKLRARPLLPGHPEPDALALVIGFAFCATLCVCFSRTIGFLNLSSCHFLYTTRITRAYQGASSLNRWEADAEISQTEPQDDVEWKSYQPYQNGGPLHLVNCALNCTESLETGAESTTAKGMNLCVGPAGIAYGQHQTKFKVAANGPLEIDDSAVLPCPVMEIPEADQTKAKAEVETKVEPLTLGRWIGISGAAFSTGLGNVGGGGGTALGTSLLCGMFNVRLGYWWENGFSPARKLGADLPVQASLLDEFTGNFHILERDHWYLSDGGHFENTAAYELIRRRVPFIILADCGADPDGAFDDLGNLARRVRMDFGAEIVFAGSPGFKDTDLEALIKDDAGVYGQLEDLRLEKQFIRRSEVHIPADVIAAAIKGDAADLTSPPQARRCRKYATFATVTYAGEEAAATTILIIKPGLTGKEPADLLNYQRKNPEFPQQTTVDQFFDEAQWESYRKLGQHVMDQLLAHGTLGRRLKAAR